MAPSYDHEWIRIELLKALFTTNAIAERIILKGGNALALGHKISKRTSLDLDFSLLEKLTEEDEAAVVESIINHFQALPVVPFDIKIEKKPRPGGTRPLLGYKLSLKFAPRDSFDESDLQKMRIQRAFSVDGQKAGEKEFTADFSLGEYCEQAVEIELDGLLIVVCALEVALLEKLRAICQQMKEYTEGRPYKGPRARDFFDVWQILQVIKFDPSASRVKEMALAVFSLKKVDLALLGKMEDEREYHRTDWPSVILSLRETPEEFDFYFDLVVKLARRCEALWNV
jgi:predicted nucleotidyltransferase component of viral defense system